jgi:hypothetical protein
VARTVSYGLERWSAGAGVVVWSGATDGCGIADEGKTPDASGRLQPVPRQCRGSIAGLADAVKQLDPDVVLVYSSVFDLQDRVLDGWPGVLRPGDARFDDYLVAEYVDAYDTLSAKGAKVVCHGLVRRRADPVLQRRDPATSPPGSTRPPRLRPGPDRVSRRSLHREPGRRRRAADRRRALLHRGFPLARREVREADPRSRSPLRRDCPVGGDVDTSSQWGTFTRLIAAARGRRCRL